MDLSSLTDQRPCHLDSMSVRIVRLFAGVWWGSGSIRCRSPLSASNYSLPGRARGMLSNAAFEYHISGTFAQNRPSNSLKAKVSLCSGSPKGNHPRRHGRHFSDCAPVSRNLSNYSGTGCRLLFPRGHTTTRDTGKKSLLL